MINRESITAIGTLGKTHGLQGEINSYLEVSPDDLEYVILDMDGILVPFYLENIRTKNHFAALLKFDGINSLEEASKLVGKTVYTDAEIEVEMPDESDADFYIGYTIYNSENRVGEIIDVDSSTENILFVVNGENGEVLIPVTMDFITDINKENRRINMTLPNGLV